MMTTSQDWWPADYGHYGPLFIRMTWHAAGTYRIADGRGGGGERRAALRPAQQLARQRQPRQGAPAALAGQAEVRPEDLVGRPDRLRRQLRARVDGVHDVRLRLRARGHLGARRDLLGSRGHVARRRALQRRPRARRPVRRRADGPDLREPGGARTATRIRWRRRRDIRETFARMAMDDEETVALIVGGHTFGKCHGAGERRRTSARSPRAARSRRRASAGRTRFGTGKGADTITSGLEGAWTNNPTQWDNGFLDNLYKLRVGADDEPGRREAVDAHGSRGAGRRCPTRTTRRSGTRR